MNGVKELWIGVKSIKYGSIDNSISLYTFQGYSIKSIDNGSTFI